MRTVVMVSLAAFVVLGCQGEPEITPPKPPALDPPKPRSEQRLVESHDSVRSSPSSPSASPPPSSPTIAKSKCLRTAKKLVVEAKSCGISFSRSAQEICVELLTVEEFTDDMAVGRLNIFMNDGCEKLRVAIENDRV